MELTVDRSGAAGVEPRQLDTARLDVEAIARAGPVLVAAPHPDDESLGCGGLLALLAHARARIVPVLLSDGEASHPHSRRWNRAARAELRAGEWRDALACLGIASGGTRLRLPDGAIPRRGEPGHAAAASAVRDVVAAARAATLLLPWRRDPHPDHRACHVLFAEVLRQHRVPPRCLEYGVWIHERADPCDWPRPDEVRMWSLDVRWVAARKRAAIAAHRSQHGVVIDDDLEGFTISPAMRRRAEQPTEWFFESIR